MSILSVSVIIPVYNAERYLRKAVESAHTLDEVSEIILVEDKSPDNALDLCQSLEKEYKKVILYQHPDKGNHGAGASRNLGIQMATCPLIAFLDADDYYLPNRFKKDIDILSSEPDTDGVYSALGIHYYSEKARQMFYEAGYKEQEFLSLSAAVPPNELFAVLFNKHPRVTGEFHTNNITVRKKVFDKIGYFNTTLRLRQDIHLWRRMAAYCSLKSGELTEPVAIRGVHEENRMTRKNDHKKYIAYWWESLKQEFQKNKLSKDKRRVFNYAYHQYLLKKKNKFIAMYAFIRLFPKLINSFRKPYGAFDFAFWDVFGKNQLSYKIIAFKNKWV